ncbi:MAG: hypothetical protein ACRCYE_13800 [Sarcina sp.]
MMNEDITIYTQNLNTTLVMVNHGVETDPITFTLFKYNSCYG